MKPVGAALLVAAWICLGSPGPVGAETAPAEDRGPGESPPAAAAHAPPGSDQPAPRDSAAAPAGTPSPVTTGSTSSASPAAAAPDTAATAASAVAAAAAASAPGPAATPAPPAKRKARTVRPAAAPRAGDTPPNGSPSPAPALAQANGASDPGDGSEAERVAREIARTAMWLTRAATQVPRSPNGKASSFLTSAREFQLGARDAYEVRQYARAQRLTQAARDYADRAIRLSGPATDDPEYVKTVVKRTDDALDRLKDYLDAGGTPAARREYESLKEDQKNARKLLDEGKARDAYRATTGVRDGVLAMLREAPPADVPCESAKKAVENADASRDKVREDIGKHPDPETARYLASADLQLSKAHALLTRGSCRDAVLRAKAAERQMEKAIDASRQVGGRGR